MSKSMENTSTETTTEAAETNTEPVSNSVVRESNLFKGMASEVTKLKRMIEERDNAEAEKQKAEELSALEGEAKYKEALEKLTGDFQTKLSSKEQELMSLMQQVEHKDIIQKLLMNGVSGTKASDFLANEYKAIEGEDKPDLDTWITTIKEDSEYLSFFGNGETTQLPRTPDGAGNASRKGAKLELDSNMSAAEMMRAALESLK